MLKLLKELVSIKSISGFESEIREYIEEKVDEIGFKAKADDVGNLIIEGSSDLWFVTHMDTVPIKSEFRYDGEFAYGTGVCDAKGCIAAIIDSLTKIDELRLNFAFFVDEEEGGTGSEHFSKNYLGRAVVMEPTDMKIAERQFGSAEVILRFKGDAAHGAYWDKGLNAIDEAIKFAMELRKRGFKFSIQKIEGGSDEYLIPDDCAMRLSFVFDERIEKDVFVKNFDKENLEFEISEFYEPIECDRIKELEMFVKDKTVMISWTDAYNLKKNGWTVTIWGPGELINCHTAKEKVRIKDIERASEIISRVNDAVEER